MDKKIIEIAIAAFIGIFLGCFIGVARIQAVSQSNQHQSSQTNPAQHKAQVKAKVVQVKAFAKTQKAQVQTPSSNHQQSENDILIHNFVEILNKISLKYSASQDDEIKKASIAYQNLYEYNKKNPHFVTQFTQKQKDLLEISIKKLSKYIKIEKLDENIKFIDFQLIQNFSKSVDLVPHKNSKDYNQKVEIAINFFKKIKIEVKNHKSISSIAAREVQKAAKILFGSMTRQEALQLNEKLHFEDNSKNKNEVISNNDNNVRIQCSTCCGNCCSWFGGCCSCCCYTCATDCCDCSCGCYADLYCDECNCECGSTCGICNICNEVNCAPCVESSECNSGNCVDGLCYITGCQYGMETCGNCYGGADGDPCVGDSNCKSGNCWAGFCSCNENSCPCTSNSNCESGNCYLGFCSNCIIPTPNPDQEFLVNTMVYGAKDGSKGSLTPYCENDGQCCNCYDGHCGDQGQVVCNNGLCTILTPNSDVTQTGLGASGAQCTTSSDCSSNLCINGTCSCGSGNGCSCHTGSTCATGICTNNICVEPCIASGGTCSTTTDCCAGYTCTSGICSNNNVTCSANSDCTSGICDNNLCQSCGVTGWSGCTYDSQCCTGNNCVSGICSCSSTGCACGTDNSNCQSGVCDNGVCAASCLVSGAQCSDSGQCCDGTTCMESNNNQSISYCVACGNEKYTCSANSDCCSNICVNGICSCNTNGCACTEGSSCETGVCTNGVCNCINDNQACTSNVECCSNYCNANGKCANS